MAKYRLMAAHHIGGVVYPEGTEVGDDTKVPFDGAPSNQMMGLDDEGKEKVNELHQNLYGKDADWHTPEYEERERRAVEERDKQRKEEAGRIKEHGAVPVTPGPTGGIAPKGGQVSGGPGMPAPKQDPADPDVQPRVKQPLKEQLPKGE